MLRLIPAVSFLAVALTLAVPVRAEPCTEEAFSKAIDGSGAALRRLSAESQPKLQAGFRRLREKHGWSEDDYVEKANGLLADQRSEAFDAKTSELLARLDRLAEPAPSTTDCARLAELEATALELQAAVRAKTQYMLARLEAQIDRGSAAPKSSAPAAPLPQASAAPLPAPKSAPPKPPAVSLPAPPPKPPAPAPWNTTTVEEPTAATTTLPAPPAPMPGPSAPSEDGYSIDEIREAARGLFGTISTGLASVIEHTFAKSGRPSAYILGQEGGGAFIAGVRYGNGTLYLRRGGTREVYWHGPSIGYDFGASGSKTLFLVYGLKDPLDIFAGFSGVDGSAYLVGGVGVTFLTDGRVVMAPIRSGIGLRFGASVGYVRFTARPTWNPF